MTDLLDAANVRREFRKITEAATELIYRHELRPVVAMGAQVMDRILNAGMGQ